MRTRNVAIVTLLVGCRAAPPSPLAGCDGLAGSGAPVVRVVVVTHSEAPSIPADCLVNPEDCHPDYTASIVWSVAEPVVRGVAETLAEQGRAWSFQTESNFAQGALYADSDVLVRVAALGHEVTPHTHGNRADVATWIRRAGVEPGTVAGGIIYDPPEAADWPALAEPVYGMSDPETPWQASVLWGAATADHAGVDDVSSGVWRPADAEAFFEDQPGNLPYVGGYTRDVDGVRALVELMRGGGGEPGGFYTAAVMTDLHQLIRPGALPSFLNELGALDEVEDNLRWQTVAETAAEWGACNVGPT